MSKITLNVVGINGKAVTATTKEFDTDRIKEMKTYVPASNSSNIATANSVIAYAEPGSNYTGSVFTGSIGYREKGARENLRPTLYYVVEATSAISKGYTLKEVITHTWAGGVTTTDTATAVYPIGTTDLIEVNQLEGATALSAKGVRAAASTITLTTGANAANGYKFQIIVYSKNS